MKHAFIMDPLESVKAWKDTSYYLMKAAYDKGYQVCYLDQQSLYLEHDVLYGKVSWLDVNADVERPFTILKDDVIEMATMDAVWVRTDPPFNRRYFYTTLLLDFLPSSTRILNQPACLRDWNEKLAALKFPQFTPATMVTNKVEDIQHFSERIGRLTVKPVDGFGGKGIVFYDCQTDDVSQLTKATHDGRHWVIAQEYLPAANEGDKRILLLNGEPLGAILRVHAEGVELNNLDAGGTAVAVDLTEEDRDICQALKQELVEQGAFFVGIDVIGGKLIEVNVTSPTGLQELCRFHGKDYHHEIITALEDASL